MMIPTYLERVLRKAPAELLEELDPDVKFQSVSGSRYKSTYQLVTDDVGHFDLKETGVIDVYSEIQSHKDSVDIGRIIARLKNGDTSVLERHAAFFADVSDIPNNYAAILQKMADAELIFAELPAEKRALFHNDPSEFIASFGSEKFASVFKTESNKDPDVSSDEVKESESNE